MKNAAYDCLIMKCKELFLNANKDFVIKKISSLKSSFRHQLRRINKMKKNGTGANDVPECTLWYFDLLSFVLDQEEVRKAISSLDNKEDNNKNNKDELQNLIRTFICLLIT